MQQMIDLSAGNEARMPSFVDLRAFLAERLGALRDLPQGGQSFLRRRVALQAADRTSPVGAILLTHEYGHVPAMPADEFVLVVQGRVEFVTKNGTVTLEDGDAAVLPMGCAFDWKAEDEAQLLYMRYPGSTASDAPITPLSKAPEFLPSAKPAADILVGPAPECSNHNDYRVDDGRFVCGTWTSTAYQRHGFRYGHYEIMYLLAGSVTLTDETGRSQTFAKGDIVLAEEGAHCAWQSREDVTKLFAIYRV